MAAVTFDTLKCAKRLIEAGVPVQQAEAQAEVLADAFVHNVDNLVTKDYLDARLEALEERIDGKLRLQNWMMGVAFSILVLPQLRALFGI